MMWVSLVLASLVLTVTAEEDTTCRPGYLQSGHLCFKYIYETLTYFEAVTACDVIDGKVLEVAAQEDQQLVENYLNSLSLPATVKTIWIGATDLQTEGHWLYASHSNEEAIAKWNHWAPGSPAQDTSTNCAVLSRDSSWQWTAQPCQTPAHVICFDKLDIYMVG